MATATKRMAHGVSDLAHGGLGGHVLGLQLALAANGSCMLRACVFGCHDGVAVLLLKACSTSDRTCGCTAGIWMSKMTVHYP